MESLALMCTRFIKLRWRIHIYGECIYIYVYIYGVYRCIYVILIYIGGWLVIPKENGRRD